MKREDLLSIVATLLGLSLFANSQPAFSAEPKPEYGFEVGKSMAFHVVDFMAKGSRRGGCPSVMISNSRKMGVEIWSRSLDDSAIQLAARLQDVLPARKRPNCFLLVFDKAAKETITKKAGTFGLKKFFVCTPRPSARNLMKRADPGNEYSTIVFVEDREVIKAVWRFPQGKLDKKAIERVVKGTQKLLSDMP